MAALTILDDGYATGNAAPNLTIEGCDTLLGAPVGIFVDEATVDVCTGTAVSAADLCDPSSGNPIVPVRTRPNMGGQHNYDPKHEPDSIFALVAVYAPELADIFSGLLPIAPSSPDNG